MHLTLRFFGHFPEAELATLRTAIHKAAQEVTPMNLQLAALGCFPSTQRPRILWLGIRDDQGGLQLLHRALLTQTRPWGEEEPRPFQPHLTLARLKESRSREAGRLQDVVTRNENLVLGQWTADSIELMRSELKAEGAEYHLMESYPLGTD